MTTQGWRQRTWFIGVALVLQLLSAAPAKAQEQGYEWAVTYIRDGYTWHKSPKAALDEYVRVYEVTAGCVSSQCKCEIVRFELRTWPSYAEEIRCWKKDGKVSPVRAGSVNYRKSNTPPGYWVEVEPPESANNDPCCKNPQGDPVDPTSGAVYLNLRDVDPSGGPLEFRRYYNSQEKSHSRMSPGWWHSYARRVIPFHETIQQRPWPSVVGASSTHSTPGAACSAGFAQIRGQIEEWESAGAVAVLASGGNSCDVSAGGTRVGRLRLYSTISLRPPAQPIGL